MARLDLPLEHDVQPAAVERPRDRFGRQAALPAVHRHELRCECSVGLRGEDLLERSEERLFVRSSQGLDRFPIDVSDPDAFQCLANDLAPLGEKLPRRRRGEKPAFREVGVNTGVDPPPRARPESCRRGRESGSRWPAARAEPSAARSPPRWWRPRRAARRARRPTSRALPRNRRSRGIPRALRRSESAARR